MNDVTKLAGFATGLVLTFGAAAGIGHAAGPTLEIDDTVNHSGADHAGASGMSGSGAAHSDGAAGGHAGHSETSETNGTSDISGSDAATLPGGLMVSQNGYTLTLGETRLPAGAAVPLSLTITDGNGDPVTAFDVEHEKELHLIAVRRDGSGFQHVHPVMDAGGTWRTRLDLDSGPWRVFADMAPTGAGPLTLGADLDVPGAYEPITPPAERRSVETAGGYTVTVSGDLAVGEESELTLTVSRDGRPVTDLDPYLGAYGHLVALRQGDLAYLHVHPDGTPGDGTTEPGPKIVFYAEAPSAGSYQLYLDFQHNGVVRTAPLSLAAPVGGASTATAGGSTRPSSEPGAGESGAGESGDIHSDDGHSH